MKIYLISILIFLKYFLAVSFLALLGFLFFIMASFRNKVPFVPTPKRIIRMMIQMAEIRPNERICDLGSGTGRIIFAAAKQHKQNLVIGIEKSFTLRLVSNFLLCLHPFLKKRIKIVDQDFFNLDMQQFDVIFCFLTPDALRILEPKFQFLKPGSRVVSYMFPLENYENFREVSDHVSDKDSIYYYQKMS
jgi:precorrin-6B methylase 2